MITKIVKWSAIVALVGGASLHSVPSFELLSQFVVAIAAVIVLAQAANLHRYVWMTLFLVVLCLFNPIFPVPFSKYIFGIVTGFAVVLFFFSLELLQPKTGLSIASITHRMPGSDTL
jgi:flagellar biosynthesis protein FlhB